MQDSTSNWQQILSQGFGSSRDLLQFLQLDPERASVLAEQQFKTRVPRGFAALMEANNPQDPLLLQVLASPEELIAEAGYFADPLDENRANPEEGLLHKYHGRVLLTLTGSCAINCRYCFRRHFPYENNNPGTKGWKAALDYISKDSGVYEVILSGGDPLLAKDSLLENILTELRKIKHLQILRFHSRIPVVLPERIDASFLGLMQKFPLQKVMVLHANHPNELDERVASACRSLREAGFQLFNQSVLLAKVNDRADTLAQLSRRLFSMGVTPYYLHVLDKVQGAAHFDLSMERSQQIYQELQSLLPGYLVPRLAKEEPGLPNKKLL